MYSLINADVKDKALLIKWKLSTIYEYANNLDEEEKERINSYVNKSVSDLLNDYKVIVIDNKKVGSFLVTDYDDGVLLDEIYLEWDYRHKGVGTELIRNLLSKHNVVYLWVYKDNIRAIKLYERLSFKIVEETDSRYFMKYINE